MTMQHSKKSLLARFGHSVMRHVIPHKSNDYLPHLLQHHLLLGYSVFLVFLKVVAVLLVVVLPSASVYSSAISEGTIVSLTNSARQMAGLDSLIINPTLTEAATRKAVDMVQNNYFAHTSPQGITPWRWFREVGYDYQVAGENLAVHFSTAEDVHAGWIASPSHKKNILDSRFTEIGIGVARGEFESYNTTFVVELFALPKTLPQPVESGLIVAQVEPISKEPVTEVLVPETPAPSSIEDRSTVVPVEGGYEVTVIDSNAESVTAQLNGKSTPLTAGVLNEWTGTVPKTKTDTLEASPVNDVPLYVVTTTDGQNQVDTIANVYPAESVTSDVFAPAVSSPERKLFGFLTINHFEDSTKKIFLYAVIALGALLIVNICVKLSVQKHSVIIHTLGVMVLALILWVV